MKKLYVLTGGPGVGKSTVLEILRREGYPAVEEQARKVIAEESKKKNGISANDLRFQLLLAQKQLEEERKLPITICFLDRSIIDSIAYLQKYGNPIPPELEKMISKSSYEKSVFLLEMPPQHLFGKKGQTFATYDDSHALHQMLIDAYQSRGYSIIKVPFASFDTQAEFIENEVKRLKWR